MYTRCPACLTTFKVTPAQLEAQDGLVRCGICSAIFRAKQRLLEIPPETGPEPAEDEATATGKSARGAKSKGAASQRRGGKTGLPDIAAIPVVSELPPAAKSRSRLRPWLWGLGDVLLILLFTGQFMYLYRDELAQIPAWRPALAQFCRYAGCQLRPRQDIAMIEWLETTIAPHPKYENALRLRATLVNRAGFSQAHPRMEVSLTNSAGDVIARRTFTPAQYLATPAAGKLPPNVVAAALLDVTNPDSQAFGYEIRLVTR